MLPHKAVEVTISAYQHTINVMGGYTDLLILKARFLSSSVGNVERNQFLNPKHEKAGRKSLIFSCFQG